MREAGNNSEIHWQAMAKTDSTSIIRVGFWSVCMMMLVFLIWALFFPLASAVVTTGTFVSDGKNKQIQHQKGGRVKKIMVREGETVKKGQPILELDRAQVQAELTQLAARHSSLLALKSRLDAERSGGVRAMHRSSSGLSKVKLRGSRILGSSQTTPPQGIALRGLAGKPVMIGGRSSATFEPPKNTELLPASHIDDDAAPPSELVKSQQDAYLSGRKLLAQEIEVLDKKAESLNNQKQGLLARIRAQKELLALRQSEYERIKPLANSGYVARNRLDESRRTVLELQGAITVMEYDVEGVEGQISEVAITVEKARTENSDAAFREYTKIVSELAEIIDQLKAAQQSFSGSIVRAPASGILTSLLTTTVGGVVGAADVIGEIVPEGAPLVVQARVLPGDIDYVQVDQHAKIAVTAFNRRIDDTLEGTVLYKSADANKDEKTGDAYFTVRLQVADTDGNGHSRLGDIQAGMQSEVYIQTGSRTFLTYLAKPMIDSFRRAFREQ